MGRGAGRPRTSAFTPMPSPLHPSIAPSILQVGGLGTFGNGRVLFLEVTDPPSVDAVTGLQVGRGLVGVGGAVQVG